MLGALGRVSAEEHDYMVPYYFRSICEEPEIHTSQIDLKQADTARRYKTANPKGNFMMSDASSLPFARGKVDMVIANSILRASKDKSHPEIFREAHRVLNPNGGLFMVEALPDKIVSDYDKQRTRGITPEDAYRVSAQSYLSELGDMLLAAGFTEVVFYRPDHFRDRKAVCSNLYWQDPGREKQEVEVIESAPDTVPDIIPHNGCVAIYANKRRQGSGEKFLDIGDVLIEL